MSTVLTFNIQESGVSSISASPTSSWPDSFCFPFTGEDLVDVFLPEAGCFMAEMEQQTVDQCTGDMDKQRESVMSNEEQCSERLSNSRESQLEHDDHGLTGHRDFPPPALSKLLIRRNGSM